MYHVCLSVSGQNARKRDGQNAKEYKTGQNAR